MKILLADDDRTSRTAVNSCLKDTGHELIFAEDGKQALDVLSAQQVNTAVLDWEMPYYTGPEICRIIRSSETESCGYTYVIMLTMRDNQNDLVEGLEAGADDYITKPFDRYILRSRINVAARIVEYESNLAMVNRELKQLNEEISEAVEERSRQLVHAERMATIGLLTAGVAHEINNPATFISGNCQTLEMFWKDISPHLVNSKCSTRQQQDKLDFIIEQMPQVLKGIHNGVERISRIVKGLKSYCRQNHSAMSDCDINRCIEQSLELCHNRLKYDINIEKNLAPGLALIKADSQQIDQVLVNLFVNAADAVAGRDNSKITITTCSENNKVTLKVADNGNGIKPENLENIWKPFFTTKEVDKGTGLGLYTVRGIVENHGGTITVQSSPQQGTVFTLTFPTAKKVSDHESKIADS